ncbi:MAG: PepSY domain-containing protein [Rhodobacteraceae bacterium]|nr:PepSY domain-containing protein [Paracoccaceae bacterium]
MTKTLTALALIALLPAGAALASDDCHSPRDQWQPREAALKVAEQNGWTVREFEIDDGCYEIEGRDSDGRLIDVSLDPATLQIVEMEFEDDDDRYGLRNPALPQGQAN